MIQQWCTCAAYWLSACRQCQSLHSKSQGLLVILPAVGITPVHSIYLCFYFFCAVCTTCHALHEREGHNAMYQCNAVSASVPTAMTPPGLDQLKLVNPLPLMPYDPSPLAPQPQALLCNKICNHIMHYTTALVAVSEKILLHQSWHISDIT